jgi:outer membrane protein
MKKPFICLCTFLLSLSVFGQEKWDLRKCVEYALANNITVKKQDVQAAIGSLMYDQSRLSQYPNLNFGSNLGLSTGRSIDRTTNQFTNETIFYNTFSLQSSVDIFNFFSKKNTIAADKLQAEAGNALVEKIKNDIALSVAGQYLTVLLAKQQIDVIRVQMQKTKDQLENTRKMVKAGAVPELNAAQFEAQLAQDSSALVSAKSNSYTALYNLKALLALDVSTPFDIVTPPIELIPVEPLSELQPENVYRLALVNLPQQQVTRLRLKAAEKYVAAAKGKMYPSIGASGALQTNYSNSKNNVEVLTPTLIGSTPIGIVKTTSDTVFAPKYQQNFRFFTNPYTNQIRDNLSKGLGLNISVPIFNGASARTGWQRARLDLKSLQLDQQLDTLTLKQDIYKAYTDAITALEKFNASKKVVEMNEKAFDFASKRYNAGLLGTIDYLITQSNLVGAKLNMSLAQFEYVFKMKVLEFYKGQGLKL